jgi:hypothetical protein
MPSISSGSSWAPQAPLGSAFTVARPCPATQRHEPDSPQAAHLAHAAWSQVVDVALSSDQLILGILQLGAGVVEEVRLHVATAIGPYQLVVPLLDACFQTVVLLKKLAVTLLDVLDEAVLHRHLVVVLLQV